jgi:hypothetical protein
MARVPLLGKGIFEAEAAAGADGLDRENGQKGQNLANTGV